MTGEPDTPRGSVFLPNALLDAVRTVQPEKAASVLAAGFKEVNYAEPSTGLTALHYAAGRGFRDMVRMLVATGRCNYSLQDRHGRTAATVAIEVAEDAVLGRYLYRLQYRQQPHVEPAQRRDAV